MPKSRIQRREPEKKMYSSLIRAGTRSKLCTKFNTKFSTKINLESLRKFAEKYFNANISSSYQKWAMLWSG
jgi:hypothetical protein